MFGLSLIAKSIFLSAASSQLGPVLAVIAAIAIAGIAIIIVAIKNNH
jgi:hypothetical protein